MSSLRVALIAGTLGRGGAERQLVHMVGALLGAGADVRVCCVTRGEHHEQALRRLGVHPVWVGQSSLPAARVITLTAALVPFRPHVVQASHFFANLYATISGRAHGAAAIGAIRSDLEYEFQTLGRWARPLLLAPPDVITNSWMAHRAAVARGRPAPTVHVIPNVVALSDFEPGDPVSGPATPLGPGPIAIAVGSLSPVKRMDRFLEALALARRQHVGLRGIVVGDGPERARLEALAANLGLNPTDIHFAGAREDVPAWLRRAAFLVLPSDHEGCPNAVLEAMASRLPVIVTPCGDLRRVVQDGISGFIVPFNDNRIMADRMAQLAADDMLRQRLGECARREAELYDRSTLAHRMLGTYRTIAARRTGRRLAEVLT